MYVTTSPHELSWIDTVTILLTLLLTLLCLAGYVQRSRSGRCYLGQRHRSLDTGVVRYPYSTFNR